VGLFARERDAAIHDDLAGLVAALPIGLHRAARDALAFDLATHGRGPRERRQTEDAYDDVVLRLARRLQPRLAHRGEVPGKPLLFGLGDAALGKVHRRAPPTLCP